MPEEDAPIADLELLTLAPDPMLVADRAGRIVAGNGQLNDLFGYTGDALIGQPVEVLIPPELRDRHPAHVADFVRSPSTRMMGDRELQACKRDGTLFPCEISLGPLPTAGGFYVVAAIRDITRRKQIERRLRETEEQFDLIFQASPEPYFLVGCDRVIRTCNAAAERLFGDSIEGPLRDRDMARLFFVHPEDAKQLLSDFEDCAGTGQPMEREAVLSPTEHHGLEVEYTLTPLTKADGAFSSIFVVCRDISKRKAAEREQLEARRRAEAALHELQETRSHLYDAERQAALGRTVAGVAHEIRNPLNFIRNYAEAAAQDLQELKTSLSANEQRVVEEVELIWQDIWKIRSNAQRLENIVRSMMLLARKEHGPVETFGINTLLNETAEFALQARARANSVLGDVLAFDLDPSEPEMQGRPPDLARAFLNIIENALYALRSQTASDQGFEPRLSISTRRDGDEIVIAIEDNGPGIPESAQEQLFTPFFTTKPSGDGTGLGLSICHETIVAGHGGRIDLDTETGRHTRFTIRLPVRMSAGADSGASGSAGT